MEIKIIGLGEIIPDVFENEINNAKEKLPDLTVNFCRAPSFSTEYKVDSPLVKYSNHNINTIEYGENGLALIRDVVSGKIR